MARVTFFDHLQTRSDTIAHGALYSGTVVFIRDIALVPNDRLGLEIYKLKQKVPEVLQGHVPDVIEGGTCEDYHKKAIGLGLDYNMHQVFPLQNFPVDFDSVEIGSHHWQPKLDVLTARFDALDLVNALDQELVDEFVAQLSAGGDAFALIDAKVLVETQRATTAEGVVSSGLAQEVSDRDAADVILQSAIDAVQSDVDQNEQDADSAINSEQVRAVAKEDEIAVDLAQEVSDRGAADVILQSAIDAVQSDVDQNEQDADSAINAEEVRAVAKEDEIAVDLAQEIVDRGIAVTGEASARAQAITQEVSDRDAAIATAVADLINSAPGALDTLKDLADALGNDDEFSVTLTGLINAKQNQLTHGIADGNTLKVVGSASTGDFPRFTLTGLEPRSLAGFKSDLTLVKADVSLGSVENTALSTWAGSSVVSALGNVTTGEWKATAVADAYVASSATWNALRSYPVSEEAKVTENSLKTSYTDAVLVATHTSDIAARVLSSTYTAEQGVQDNAIAVNTAKRNDAANDARYTQTSTLDAAQLVQDNAIAVNTAKRDDAANDARYTQTSTLAAAQLVQDNAIAVNTAKRNDAANDARYTQTSTLDAAQLVQDNAIAQNTAKNSFPTASDTLLNVTHPGLHTAHTAALAAKQPLLDTSSLYHDTGNNRLGLGTISPGNMVHLHDTSGAASLKISRSLDDNHVEINSHGFTKYGNGAGSTAWRFRQVTQDPITIETSNTVAVTVAPSGETTFVESVILDKDAPGNASASGTVASIRVDNEYIYVCTAANTWKRVAIATW